MGRQLLALAGGLPHAPGGGGALREADRPAGQADRQSQPEPDATRDPRLAGLWRERSHSLEDEALAGEDPRRLPVSPGLSRWRVRHQLPALAALCARPY